MEKQLVKINRKVLSKEKEISLNLDFIVPDVKPDIVAILDTNASTYIFNEECGTGKIRLDGNVDSKVLYLSDSGETRSLSVMLDFSEVIDDERIIKDFIYYSQVELLSIESRIINERKINIYANVKVYVSFYEAKEIELISSLNDFENLQLKEEKCKIKSLIGCNKVKSNIKEVVELDTMDNVLDILKVDVSIGKEENKVSYNKVLSKADSTIKIVYQTEDMNIKVKTVSYPIMSFIDMENVKEDHCIETNTKLRNMNIFLTQNETNKISVNIEFETSLQVYEIKEISIIDDLYSLNKNIEYTKKEFEAELDSEIIKKNFLIEEFVDVEDISKIIDTKSYIRIVSKEQTGNSSSYNLEVNLKVMYLLDSRNGLAVKKFKFSIIAKVEEGESDETLFLISNENYNLNNDKINCNIEITGNVKKNSLKTILVLENIVEKEDIIKSEYSMVVYFVKPKDTIWEIAKNFKVSMQSIIDSNNIEDPNRINIGDKLYIVR